MPSRLFSRKNFWMALVSSAISRAFFALAGVAGAADLAEAVSFFEGGLGLPEIKISVAHPVSVSDFFCQTHIICAAFSSSVIRASRSLARREGGSAGFL